ncbi:MAG: DUF4124 domain-containing protein [Deltaproteobacteria bacterium]|nr:DUF4124 domain-containing protein [Deltaproteobacteria bacterium]
MKKLTCTIVIVFLLLAGPVTAQIYRYIDKNGDLRFTDDLNKVPAEQRPNIRKYKELEAGPAPSSKEAVRAIEKSPAASAEPTAIHVQGAAATAADGTVSIEDLRARIERMKGQLEAEYLTLAKEKDALAKGKDSKRTREEQVGYNKSVDAFNQRAVNYEKRCSLLNKLADEYNAYVLAEKPKNQKP